jgi:hypothetical protein
MKRDYTTGVKNDVKFFTGVEVEHTPQHNAWTLFVVGLHPAEQIVEMATKNACSHVYLGANQSFDGQNIVSWETMVQGILNSSDLWVTLDFDVKHIEVIHDTCLCEHRKFIPMISVKLPFVKLLNYNATLKIDDVDFKATNPGVWCHSVHNLMSEAVFTDWDHYGNDKTLESPLPDPANYRTDLEV